VVARYRPQRDQARLLLPVKLPMVHPLWWASVEGCLKTLLKVLLLRTLATVGWLTSTASLLPSRPPAWSFRTLIGFEQDASMSELAGRGGTCGDQVLELFSLGFGEDNGILFLHNL
jgi:hypothetical protein